MLVWLMGMLRPSRVTGAKGLPVPTSARPSVHSIRSCGLASARDVGLDSGKMIGRSVCWAIWRTIASVKAPACIETPISVVGLALTITSSSPM